ncbi:PREDICTED: uncharacterized protein LOC109341773 [Lupinus angustifolius]|uniref:uncharacterized protein LOC109341773 n=1 Tax=Lupinus angustifolius TaxID=3871 RepID=UPI00092FD257|nr:PREDICTED: uncharacterized protein LOC109341773 [Lupinus angustifolius]
MSVEYAAVFEALARWKPFHHNKKPYGFPYGNQLKSLRPHNNHNNNNNNQDFQAGNSNNNLPPWCSKCKGKHFSVNCPICYHYNQLGHIKPMCPKLKKEEVNAIRAAKPQAKGRVFTMSGAEIKEDENSIQGTCLVNEISLSILFDSGATHSFISHEVVNQLELPILSLPYDLVVSTPTNAPIIVSTGLGKGRIQRKDGMK